MSFRRDKFLFAVIASVVVVSIFGSPTACVPDSLTGSLFAAFAPPAAHASTDTKQKAPDWTLKDLAGNDVSLSDFKDKVVIIDFWATWCPPCRMKVPILKKLQEDYGDDGLVVIGISGDHEGVEKVRKFAEEFDINYPVVMADDKVFADYGDVQVFPTSFIIDREGNIVASKEGLAGKEYYEWKIAPYL